MSLSSTFEKYTEHTEEKLPLLVRMADTISTLDDEIKYMILDKYLPELISDTEDDDYTLNLFFVGRFDNPMLKDFFLKDEENISLEMYISKLNRLIEIYPETPLARISKSNLDGLIPKLKKYQNE